MKLAIDLHLHSCLSPCGDMDMIPENIAAMARLNGVDVIALCDHNSAKNVPAMAAAAARNDLVLLPGIEVTTREEVHVLAYFKSVEDVLSFGDALYTHLPAIANVPRFFGQQVIMGEGERIIGEEETLLLSATDLSVADTVKLAEDYGGLCVAAHINRGANGLLSNLGFLPPDAPFAALEVHRASPAPMADLGRYKILYASDAHRLEEMPDGGADGLEVCEKNAQAVFEALQAFYARAHAKAEA